MPTAANPESSAQVASENGNGAKGEILCFPPSMAQEAFFYLEKLNPGNAPFNIAVRFRLEGPLDADLLKRAFAAVVDRHEILRTRFEDDEGELLQVVEPAAEVPFVFSDLSALRSGEREARLAELGEADATKPFFLSEAPLMRVLLVKLAGDEHILHVSIHHAVADGWSIGILTDELAAFYAAFATGKPPALAPLPIQYADFAIWQKDFLAGPGVAKQLEYWKRKLAGHSELDFPTDHPRPLVKQWNGHIVSRLLPADLTSRLEDIARRNGATLFQAFLTTFKILLHRYSSSEDITIGTPVAGRDRAELEPLIGTFINSVLLRTEISGDFTFDQILQRVRDTALEALANQDLPFESLVREIKPERDAGRNPLFQINFTHQRDFVKPVEFAGVKLTALPSLSPGAIFDLHFFMVERDGVWRVSCDYNTDLFEQKTALRMLGHFQMLLESATENPGLPIGDLPLLTKEEMGQIMDWSGTTTGYPRHTTIGSLFAQRSAAHPEKTALVHGKRNVTYGQLHAYASRLALELQRQGVKTGARVAITATHSPEAMAGLVAIAMTGGAYVPIDPDHPAERIRFLMDNAGAEILLAEASATRIREDRSHHTIVLPTIGPEQDPVAVDAAGLTALHPAYVLYTSGSTGVPKGVVVPHRAVVRLVRDTNYMSFEAGEVFLQAAPLSFDASTFEIWGPLLNGGTLVILDTKSSGLIHIAQTVREQGVTTLWLTAGLFQMMVDEHIDDLKGLRHLLAGGDILSIAHVRRAHEALPHTRLINGYGPTENTTFTACHTITARDLNGTSISIGRPIANTTVFILDAHGRPVPVGVPGEIFTGGDGLALGYLGNPELTAKKFIPSPLPGRENETLYHTGDRGRWREDGTIEFLGRRDRQVKIRGVRVEPAEVEEAISTHPAIGACRVGIHGASAGSKTLVAWVSPAVGATIDRQQLSDYLTNKLPPFLCPDAIVLLENMPLTPNGKIDVAALPDPSVDTRTRSTPPATDTEKQLAGIWCELLGIPAIGRDDNFFHLGGHSLLGLKLFSRILRSFGAPLPLATLLKAPTLRSLALIIDAETAKKEQNEHKNHGVLAAIQRDGYLPPLFCVHGGDGGIIFYRNLAIHLDHNRPLIAIESQALHSIDGSVPPTVTETAGEYVNLIRKRQSRGPYFLAGYSFGGAVAYEMACILQREGENVAFLGLFDTLNPVAPHPEYTFTERVERFWNLHSNAGVLRRVQRLLAHGFSRASNRLFPPPLPRTGVDDPALLLARRLAGAHYAILKDYQPGPYGGTVTLFKAAIEDEIYKFPADYGWRNLVKTLEIITVPGRHLTIFDPENVDKLAFELDTCLSRHV